jgi:hypothetical protein
MAMPKRSGDLWVFIRNVMQQGEAIAKDFADKPYEAYARRLDAAARERTEQLGKMLNEPDQD